MKIKHIIVNVKTGKKEIKEQEHVETPDYPEPKSVDIVKLSKLIEYAEGQGWI